MSAIRNDNPDKGTETENSSYDPLDILYMIRNDNPDKGTETSRLSSALTLLVLD